MRKHFFIVTLLAAGLLLLPFISYGGGAEKKTTPPPVSQTLVREGDFAVKLANKLDVARTADEGQAEEVLAEAGIAPKSGWISDFPVTPDVLAEIRASVQAAADKGDIKIGRSEANARMLALSREMGLPMVAASGTGGTKGYITGETYGEEGGAPVEEGQYEPPATINNYYYEQGPPVVTYYPPPPDYAYLYAWDAFPFWWDTFYFPGFYVLRDFTTTVVVNSGGTVNINTDKVIVKGGASSVTAAGTTTKVVTNRVVNGTTNRTFTLDPVTRAASTTSRNNAGATRTFNRSSARNILSASEGRMAGRFGNIGSVAPNSAGTARGGWSRSGTARYSRNPASARALGRNFDPAPSLHGRGGQGLVTTPAATARNFNPAPSLQGRGNTLGSMPLGGRGNASIPNRGFAGSSRSLTSPGGPAIRTFGRPAPAVSGRGLGGPGARTFGAPSYGGRPFGGAGVRSFSAPSVRSFGGGFGGRSFGGRR